MPSALSAAQPAHEHDGARSVGGRRPQRDLAAFSERERDALAARLSAARAEILRLADLGLADPTTMEREHYELQAVAQAAAKETTP